MKTLIVFLVLLATVYCHPVKRSASSSESSEEVVKPSRLQLKATPVLPPAAPAQGLTAGSDESSDSSDEAQDHTASEDSDDSDDTDENDTDESSESAESETTSAPPAPVETTLPPITDSGRGDNLGYPSDYKKSIIFVESNKIEKGPSPYKFYGDNKAEEGMNFVSKKIYEGKDGNAIDKNLKVYKALQVHDEVLEEGTSTPDVESQGLDSASGTAEEPTYRQAEVGVEAGVEGVEEEESASATDSASASASEEEESNSSQSSEEATVTPGAADSDSSQSSESQESDSSETQETSEAPIVVTAK
ncbi:hypothetical protein AGOR_G00244300 [Albula goreensis]|uniref:Secreted phosphoprotein 1 n=1 Tax=Albula goreensis TaxID=1534307 RepID=A0A8T3CAR1_9TELE|nr:hypothetical protein AGOR_G00244300 [Albula goreensis]